MIMAAKNAFTSCYIFWTINIKYFIAIKFVIIS